VPLQLWWSVKDRIVRDQARQSAALFRRLGRLNPHAPLFAFVGSWRHSAEMRSTSRLPAALGTFGLLPALPAAWLSGLHVIAPAEPFGCSAG
jgi:hypothetical protein